MENNRAACAARGSNFFFTCLDLEEGWSIDCFLTRLTYCVEFYRTFILGKLIYLDIIKVFRQSRHYYNRINLIFFLFFFNENCATRVSIGQTDNRNKKTMD